MKILIIDAFNYIFRAFFASPRMTTKAGFPTNGLHLFTTMLLSTINKIGPDAVILAFEPEGGRKSLFRSKLYPEYKAQRTPPPEELVQQLPYFRPLVDALGLMSYSVDGYEADDIIATLTKQAVEQHHHVVIGSSDKDLMQLVREDGSVTMLLDMGTNKGKLPKWATYADVVERFTVSPDKVADVLALSGDTIDNIPGCKGIGEKTAGQLIAQFNSLENLMAHLDDIKKPAQHKNLVEFSEHAALSKQLTSLVYDVPVTLELRGFDPTSHREELRALLTKFEMIKLRRELLGEDAPSPADLAEMAMRDTPVDELSIFDAKPVMARPEALIHSTALKPELVRELNSPRQLKTVGEITAFFERARAVGRVSAWPLWSESTRDKLVGIGLASEKDAVWIAFAACVQRSLFAMANDVEDLQTPTVKALLAFEGKKCVFGIKPFVKLARRLGRPFDVQTWFDTQIAAYVLHPENAPHAFDKVVSLYLAHSLELTPENWLGSGKKRTLTDSVAADVATQNVAKWADLVDQLAVRLPVELDAHDLRTPFETLDMPLAPILANMEYEGVLLDLDALRALSQDYAQKIADLEAKAVEYAGEAFNMNSPKQVGELLYNKLKLEPARKKRTSGGAFSTDEETLESLCDQHALPRVILDYREVAKLKSTYADALLEQVEASTQRIHGNFNACVTATTRLSSSDPNLQNIPSRGEEGRKIKRAFVAREGWSFVGADYSQIELRLMAAFSKEPALCEAFVAGVDVHARTASSIFDVPVEQVTKAQRQVGKTINFALLYGMGAQKLARETGYSVKEAKAFLEKFKAQFGVLNNWFETQLSQARQSGECRTLLGHRRVITEFDSDNGGVRALGDRIAANTPVQGGASDIVKKAMIELDRVIRQKQLHAKLLLQVHDELIVECPDDEVERVSTLLRDVMEHTVEVGVPLAVELGIGKRWTDMK